jgi:membrane protein
MKNLIEKILASRRLNDFMFFYKSAEMNLSSIAVAYYLLLSLFPVLMIVGNILPFLHLDTAVILDFLQDNLPHQLYETVANIVESILSKPSTGLLSVSVLTGFWTFSKAMTSLQMAMNKAYEVRSLPVLRLFYFCLPLWFYRHLVRPCLPRFTSTSSLTHGYMPPCTT